MKETKLKENIYPRTAENIEAILLHFFKTEKHSTIKEFSEKLYDERKVDLNEIEYLAARISDNLDWCKANFKNSLNEPLMVRYMKDAIEGVFVEEKNWSGREPRFEILRKYKAKFSPNE